MASLIRIDWRSRFNTIVELFNQERFYVCELEARTLLAHYNLPRYYRIRCLITLAQCEDDRYKAKHHQHCAEAIWNQMNTMSDDEGHVMNQLRRMLDTLEEDMIADRPEDFNDMADVVVTEVEYVESDVESSDEAAEDDSSKEDVELSDQETTESQPPSDLA